MKILSILIGFALTLSAFPVDWNGRIQQTTLSNYDSVFSWNLRQQLSINVEETAWNRCRADIDLGYQTKLDNTGNQSLPGADRLQIYGLRLEADLLPERQLTLDAGRLFLYEALPVGSLDGVRLTGNYGTTFDGALYGGVESQALYAPAIYKGSEGVVLGARGALGLPKQCRLEGAYLADLVPEARSTAATDSVPPVSEEEEDDEEEAALFNRHLAGLSFTTSAIPKLDLSFHYIHDLIAEKSHRLSSSVRIEPSDKIQCRLQAERSRPEILGRSYFERFDIKAHTLLSAGTEIKLFRSFGLSADYGWLIIEEQRAQRLDARITDERGSIGVILERGTDGEATGLVADYALPFLTYWTVSASIDYSQYRIQEGYELDQAMGNALRLAYGKNGFSAELEGRWLSGRSLKNSLQIMNRLRFAW